MTGTDVWTVKTSEAYGGDRVTLYASREAAWPDFEAQALEMHDTFGIDTVKVNDREEAEVESGIDTIAIRRETPRTKPLSERTDLEEVEEVHARAKGWRLGTLGELFPEVDFTSR